MARQNPLLPPQPVVPVEPPRYPVVTTELARAGDMVVVPVAPDFGDAGPRPLVAVRVKPWTQSKTVVFSAALFVCAMVDAVVETAIPMLANDAPFNPETAWRPLLVAALSAYIVRRRISDNTVIGTGA